MDALLFYLESEGYCSVKPVADGRYIGVLRQLFSFGLYTGLDEHGSRGRYCYEFEEDALAAAEDWDGISDPSGPWIKYKGIGGERLGPGAIEDG